jgi:hypothetical protein
MQFSLASLPCLVAAPFCSAGCRAELAGIAAVSARQTFSRKSGLCQRHAEWDGPLLGDLMGASYVLKKHPKRGTPRGVSAHRTFGGLLHAILEITSLAWFVHLQICARMERSILRRGSER